MAMTVTIWHNPRCSKSRQTLALLRDRGLAITVVEYLKTPPTVVDITTALAALNLPVQDIIRTKEAIYKELGLQSETDADRIIETLVNHPILIERPIVFHKARAAIGRPPEAVLDIL